MSWNYSPGLVVEFLEANCSGTKQSQPLNTTPMPDQFYSHGKPTEHSRISRFGMTCEPLTENLGEELLMWFQEGFRAKTFPLQEKEQDLTVSDQDSGEKWRGWSAKYDQATCLWKTAQLSLLGGSEKSLAIFPRSGMTRDGLLWELPMLERNTSESGYGFLPTPTAHNAKEGAYPAEYTRNTPTLATVAGGKINPEWTEWLMGWPINHTALKPSVTDKCRNAEQQPGESLEVREC
jgi:hypothetical protein